MTGAGTPSGAPAAPRSAPLTAPGTQLAPAFEILEAEVVKFAASPTLSFTGHVTEPGGREVYTIALSTQIMIEPAKRSYDDATRARLIELFGEPERWSATTRNFLWSELDVLVPAFTGATAFRIPLRCTYDLELAATKYLYSLPGDTVPLLFNFTGTIFYRGEEGRMQIAKVPWNCSAHFEMPVAAWRTMAEHYYPGGGYARLSHETLDRLAREKAERGLTSFDATVARLLEEAGS